MTKRALKKGAVAKAPDKAAKDADKDEFRTAKREIQAKLRNKQSFERVAGLGEFLPTIPERLRSQAAGERRSEGRMRRAAQRR